MHAPDCLTCSHVARDNAFWYLSQPHVIPVSHGSAWIHRDLYETLRNLAPGDEATFDYEGRTSPAPRVTVRMEPNGTLAGRFTRIDGSVTALSGPAIVDDEVDHYPAFITAVLVELAAECRNPGLRIVGAHV